MAVIAPPSPIAVESTLIPSPAGHRRSARLSQTALGTVRPGPPSEATMLLQYGSHLHYWCCFDLVLKQNASATWGDIIRAVRDWVTGRTGLQNDLGRRWFYAAGAWKMPDRP